jgi:osmoprotectant transport system ATP-binding protein
MIRLRGVGKRFGDTESWAVQEVSLDVRHGELLALLGSSGSGKTTTLKMINRLVEKTTGTIEVAGKDVTSLDPVTLRRGIGYAFQGVGLFPHMTVAANVAVVPDLLGWDRNRVRIRTRELLDLVGLDPDEFENRNARELSGGQAQRVGVARALAAHPDVMLLDEPFGALDPLTRDQLQEEFLALHRKLELTTVLVTHDMTEALLLADRIAVLREGKLVQVDTPSRMMNSPAEEYVATLMATPRRQADRLEALAHGGEDE